MAVEARLDTINSTADTTLQKTGENSTKLDSLKDDVSKLPRGTNDGK